MVAGQEILITNQHFEFPYMSKLLSYLHLLISVTKYFNVVNLTHLSREKQILYIMDRVDHFDYKLIK